MRLISKNFIKRELRRLDLHIEGLKILSEKSDLLAIKIGELTATQALILKQEALAMGADFALPKDVIVLKKKDDIEGILISDVRRLKALIVKLKKQPFKLSSLSRRLEELLRNIYRPLKDIRCGEYKLRISKKTCIMGIINVSPNSFYEKSRFCYADKAVEYAKSVERFCDIIDVGAESTNPLAKPISAKEELRRIIPVVKVLLDEIDLPISIDTYKPEVAKECLELGAHMINDVTALRWSKEMAKVVSKYDVPVVLMHMRFLPGRKYEKFPEYKDLMQEIYNFLAERIKFATQYIGEDKIVVDPGIGYGYFGKNARQSLEIIARLDELKGLGMPILVSPSRKSFIGKILDLPPEERLEGSLAANVICALKGANIIRTHDPKETSYAIRIVDSLKSLV